MAAREHPTDIPEGLDVALVAEANQRAQLNLQCDATRLSSTSTTARSTDPWGNTLSSGQTTELTLLPEADLNDLEHSVAHGQGLVGDLPARRRIAAGVDVADL